MAINLVSRETQNRLNQYGELLRKWQARINLVAPDTLAAAETRHFQDSLQILSYLPDRPLILVDLGTGAGFPGLPLAIARSDLVVHLVESDAKKCEFLKTVSRETQTPIILHHDRIEAVPPFFADMITARALARLDKLLAYCQPFMDLNPALQVVFLKGERWGEEVELAKEFYSFDCLDHPSQTHAEARILILTNIVRL